MCMCFETILVCCNKRNGQKAQVSGGLKPFSLQVWDMMTHFHSIKLLAGNVFKKYCKKNLGFAVLVEYYTHIRSLAGYENKLGVGWECRQRGWLPCRRVVNPGSTIRPWPGLECSSLFQSSHRQCVLNCSTRSKERLHTNSTSYRLRS